MQKSRYSKRAVNFTNHPKILLHKNILSKGFLSKNKAKYSVMS